jgi:hypothetical protein
MRRSSEGLFLPLFMTGGNRRNGMLEICFSSCCYDSLADAEYLYVFIVGAEEVSLSKTIDHWRPFTSILNMVERSYILVRGQMAGT